MVRRSVVCSKISHAFLNLSDERANESCYYIATSIVAAPVTEKKYMKTIKEPCTAVEAAKKNTNHTERKKNPNDAPKISPKIYKTMSKLFLTAGLCTRLLQHTLIYCDAPRATHTHMQNHHRNLCLPNSRNRFSRCSPLIGRIIFIDWL